MEDAKVYTAEDIEKLKQKVAAYRDTLTILKTRDSVDDHHLMKSEFSNFKTQISNVEEVMELINDKQSTQMGEYEQRISHFSGQMNDLNQTVKELNQDLSLMVNKLIQNTSSDISKKTEAPVEEQNSLSTAGEDVEEKIDRIKVENSPYFIPQTKQPPSYQQLQSLFGRAADIQEPPESVTSIESIELQEQYPEEPQDLTKKSFPAIGTHPTQIYNGLYKNVHTKSTIHLNKRVKKQVASVSEISASPVITVNHEPEKNQEVTESLDSMQNVPTIEEEKASIEKIEVSIGERESPNEKVEVSIEKGESQIEIADETNQQEHKPKEMLSIFNFFRKIW